MSLIENECDCPECVRSSSDEDDECSDSEQWDADGGRPRYPNFTEQWDNNNEIGQKRIDTKYPHVCPLCNGPAYIGFTNVDCLNHCKEN